MLVLKDYNWLWNNIEFLGVRCEGESRSIKIVIMFLNEETRNAFGANSFVTREDVTEFFDHTQCVLQELQALHPKHRDAMSHFYQLLVLRDHHSFATERTNECARTYKVLPTVRQGA